MNRLSLQPVVAPIVGAAMCVLLGQWSLTAARAPLAEQLAGRAVGVSGDEDTGRIGIYIQRWTTDQELDALRAPLAQGDAGALLRALEARRGRVGVVLLPGVQGHGTRVRERTPKNLLFAREFNTPTGRRVLVASDQRLGLGESQLDARKEVYEFDVMEIRFGSDGLGIGKVAGGADLVYDPATKMVELKNYSALPARLVNVKPEKF